MRLTIGNFVPFVAGSLALLLTGCEDRLQPIYQAENLPVPQSARSLSLQKIEARIIKAGSWVDWRIRPIRPGVVAGITSWGQHSATVAIEFDQQSYSIRYKSSHNLAEGVIFQQDAVENSIERGKPKTRRRGKSRVTDQSDHIVINGGGPDAFQDENTEIPSSPAGVTVAQRRGIPDTGESDPAIRNGGGPDSFQPIYVEGPAAPNPLGVGEKVIHREYNRRVRDLQASIDNELSGVDP